METETKKVPTSVYAEMTPNPATMKFVSNQLLIDGGHTAEYTQASQTKDSSELAEQLFNFPFVKGVFVASNFITITKTDAIQWDMVNLELRIFIKDWLEEGKAVVTKLPAQPESKEEAAGRTDFANAVPQNAEEEQIIDLLEEYVRPAVEGDGGAINFKSYQDGIVTVVLRGACSGCPSSTITLKNGIEALLKQHLPGLKEVIAEEL